VDRRVNGPPAPAADRLAARLIEGIAVSARRVDVAGVATALLEGGDGPPVVLLHGHGGFAESLGEVIAGLVDGYRIIAPDLPGLGRSELRGGQLGPAATTEWLVQLIGLTCTTSPIVVGFSAGAGIAVRYLLAGGHQVRRGVLVSPCWVGSGRLTLSLRAGLLRFARNPSRTSADRVARHLLFDAASTQARLGSRFTAIQDYLIERAHQPGFRAANRALSLEVSTEELSRITVPVAVLCGRHDRVIRLTNTQRVAAELGWPLALIDDAGHLPHLEQPAPLIGALRTAIDPSEQPPAVVSNPDLPDQQAEQQENQ
jgi:pimeloyl-ACP methyl ester carboxylesterase